MTRATLSVPAFVLTAALALSAGAAANDLVDLGAVTSTFSIVAFDPANGDMGVAVQSKYFAVGAVVPWAEPGAGIVATQANVNTGYGPKSIRLLREGLSAQRVADRLLAEDTFPRKEGRQFAILDASHGIVTYTGPQATVWAGGKKGPNYAVQGNILAGPQVVEGMAKAFEQTKGELAEKLLAALEGGQAGGGDRRGMQSAALIVLRKGGGRGYDNDYYIRLHVEDSPQPITELGRLLHLQFALGAVDLSRRSAAEKKWDEATAQARRAADLAPEMPEAHLTLGFVAYLRGDKTAALQEMKRAKELYPKFRELFDSYLNFTPDFKIVQQDAAFMKSLFGVP